MPRGRQPKMYPQDLVESVIRLYRLGHTQVEVAAICGTTQKVIWRLMLRHGIKTRPRAKRNQRGEANSSWKGEHIGYSAAHLRVAAARGSPSLCEHCGTTSAKQFDWASVTKNYADISDYIRLCRSCHHKMDGTVRNLRQIKE